MGTTLVTTDKANTCASGIAAAAAALRDGALVVFPTETVYGVAVNAADPDAVRRLREFKSRTDLQPFTVHIGSRSHARRFVPDPPVLVRRLARKGWPGPLTIICQEPNPADTEVGRALGSEQLNAVYHDGTVGLRCPDHPACARLLTDAKVPVIATSANRRGADPPLDVRAALAHLEGIAAYAIDGGPTRHNAASTIVEVRDHGWRVHRVGAIDERTVERLSTSTVLFVCTGNSCRSPMAEYLFRHALANRFGCGVDDLEAAGYRVCSAGTLGYAGAPASSGAMEAMADRGIDVSPHQSQPVTVELVHGAERIYCMSPEHRRTVVDLVPGAASRVELLDADGPVSDPMGGSMEQYRACADQIERAVARRLEEFVNEDRDW